MIIPVKNFLISLLCCLSSQDIYCMSSHTVIMSSRVIEYCRSQNRQNLRKRGEVESSGVISRPKMRVL